MKMITNLNNDLNLVVTRNANGTVSVSCSPSCSSTPSHSGPSGSSHSGTIS